ncbi:MAG: ribosome maturation factor RimP [Polyangiaceae bacterium]
MQAQTPEKSATVKGGVDLDKVRDAITPVLAAIGVELVELEWLTERAGWTLRVTIERPGANPVDPKNAGGGVSLEDCVEVSRDCSAVLDVEDLIPHQYHLEVSSPGLDRKLRGEADFVRFRGMLAKVKLARPAPDGQRVLRGPIDEAPEGRVAIVADGKRVEVPAADVLEARLVYELTTGQKKGKAAKGARKADKPAGQKKERGGAR